MPADYGPVNPFVVDYSAHVLCDILTVTGVTRRKGDRR
nr:MAG TPA_asm: hypothetical protein [Caudoviricetes sp.]